MSNENIARNWCFCDIGDNEKAYYNQDGSNTLLMPHEWRLQCMDNEPFTDSSGVLAFRPEAVVMEKWGAADDIRNEVFELPPDGKSFTGSTNVLKVFKGKAPVLWAMHQALDVEPGARYGLHFYVYNDAVEKYTKNGKERPEDAWALQARAGFSVDGKDDELWSDVVWGDWHNHRDGNFIYGEYGDIYTAFVPETDRIHIWLEVMGKWGIENNGVFVDACVCHKIEDPLPGDDPDDPGTPDNPADNLQYLYTVYLNTENGQLYHVRE